MHKIRIWKRNDFSLIGTPTGYILGFQSHPQLQDRSILLPNQGYLNPGHKLSYIGGPKKSAGYVNIDMIKDNTLRYLGVYCPDDETGDEFVCFEQCVNGIEKPVVMQGYVWCCYAWQMIDDKGWMFTSPSVSMRMVQIEDVRFAK